MPEQHFAQNEQDEGRIKENAELLISNDNIDTVEKQNLLEKIVELMKKDNLPNPQNLRRIDRVRLKEKTKLGDEVIDSVQLSNITKHNKLLKCGALVITQLLEIKETKNKRKKEPFWKKPIGQYRPLTCLPLIWKLLAVIVADEIYSHLEENSLLPEEQKGCRRNSRSTKDQLLIDKAVMINFIGGERLA